MAGMSRKEITRLLDYVEPQGVTTTRTKKGVLLRLPDNSTTMLHFTGSDHRERENVRARLRRAGVSWPTDGDKLPDSIIASKPQKSTLEKAQKALLRWEGSTITGAQLRRLLPEGETMTVVASQRALYHLGWTPSGPTTARKWWKPLELEPEPNDLPAEDAAEPEPNPVVQLHPEPEPEPTPEPAPEDREFIDTHDSWTGDMGQLPENLTVAELRTMLAAFGLQLELRTWRANAQR